MIKHTGLRGRAETEGSLLMYVIPKSHSEPYIPHL